MHSQLSVLQYDVTIRSLIAEFLKRCDMFPTDCTKLSPRKIGENSTIHFYGPDLIPRAFLGFFNNISA